MDSYIKDFDLDEIKTIEIDSVDRAIQCLGKNYNNFSIFHTNIRSVSRNFAELEVLLQRFGDLFDVIVLTETWQIPYTDLYKLKNYTIFYNNGDINQNDGVLIYVKTCYDVTVSVVNIASVKCIRAKIKLKSNNTVIGITAIYKSPSISINYFNRELENFFKNEVFSTNEVFLGDLNINILNLNLVENQQYLNILYEYGFKSTINKFTRVCENTKSCLDHIFIRGSFNNSAEVSPVILNSKITDHYPTILQVNLQKNHNSQNTTIKEFINYKKCKEILFNADFSTIYSLENVNTITEKLINIITTAMTKSKYTKTIDLSKKKKPWITLGIIKSMKKRDELYRDYKKRKDERTLQNYKDYRNKIITLIKKQKEDYYKKIFLENKQNNKKMWQTFKDLIGKKSANCLTEPINILNKSSNKIEKDVCKVSEIFNNHYTSLGEKLANEVLLNLETNVTYDNLNKEPSNLKSLFLTPVNEDEIKNIIKSLKNKACPGHDCISSVVLKEVDYIIAKPLCFLINMIFIKGICPIKFKMTIVKPIFKKGEKLNVENYRPISLISNLCKVFEKALKSRLVDFLSKNNILSNLQFGFQKNKSTQDAIALLTNKVHEGLDLSKPCAAVFIDLAKAFDTVSHRMLLSKLENIGVRGNAFSLIQSYLSGRIQQVQLENNLSETKEITYGVPQGTVLGPVLFIIYLNELLLQNFSGSVISFADDTVLFVQGNTWTQVNDNISHDLNLLVKWLDKNLLTINLEKTKYLPFSTNKVRAPLDKEIDIVLSHRKNKTWNLKSTDKVEYLGIQIDCYLKWDHQIQLLTSKVRSLLYIFKSIKRFVDVGSLRTIYFALVQSLLTYGIVGWGSAYENSLKSLEVAQKRILKIVFGLDVHFPSHLLFTQSNILNIRNLYYKTSLIQSIKNNVLKDNNSIIYQTRFRYNQNLILSRMNREIGKRSFLYVGQKVFNMLPQELKLKIKLPNFKTFLSNWLVQNNPDML